MAKLPTFTGTGYRSEERFPGSLTRKLARSLAYVTGDETQALAAAMKGSGGTIDPSGFRREFQAHLATLAAHPGVPAKEPPNDGRDLDGKTRAALIEIGWAPPEEIARLRTVLRVNLLRHVPDATHEMIDAILAGET